MKTPLFSLRIETESNPKITELIKSSKIVFEQQKQQQDPMIDDDIVAVLKPFYQNLGLTELLLLWHENYNTLMIMKKFEPHNGASFLANAKLITIGMLLCNFDEFNK